MESCGSAHYWARQLEKLGHKVKLMAPQFVKPYVKSNKNDRNDSEAIAEAVGRPAMRFVPIKNVSQQDIQSLHRIREGALKHKIFISNQMRGLLSEYGIVFPQGDYALKTSLTAAIEDTNSELSNLSRELFTDLFLQFKQADEKVKEYEKKIVLLAKEDEQCQKIMKIEGIGPLIATAIVSAVGNARNFKNGREMAAWLGLVPKHTASGEKKRLLGITKRGDNYLRKLLIQGGRSLILSSKTKRDKRSLWITQKYANAGYNKTAVAVANKNARIIWALLYKNEEYKNATT
jgi:transposase